MFSEIEKFPQKNLLETLEHVSDIVLFLSPSMHILWANDSTAQFLNKTLSEIIGQHYHTLSQTNTGFFPTLSLNTLTEAEDLVFEIPLTNTPNNKVEWRLIHTKDNQNSLQSFILIGEITTSADTTIITRETENPFQENSDQFYLNLMEKTLKTMANPAFLLDEKGILSGYNKNFATLIKLPQNREILGIPLEKLSSITLWPTQQIEYFLNEYRKTINSGAATHVETPPFLLANQESIYYYLTCLPLFNHSQKIIGIAMLLQDITPQKRQEQEYLQMKNLSNLISYQSSKHIDILQEKTEEDPISAIRNYYESIIAVLPHNVYWLDRNNILLGCNDNVAKMFGLPREKCVGINYDQMSNLAKWIGGEGYSFMRDDIEVMKTNTAKYNVEEPPLLLLNGEVKHYMSSRVPLRDSKGNVIGVVGISADITERKKMEEEIIEAKNQAEEASRIKSEFLAVMSHELRTPLHGILGMTQLLQLDSNLSFKQKDHINDIYQAGSFLLSHVNDILDFSKLESGKINFELSECNFKNIILNVIKQLTPLAQKKQISLELNYPNNLYENFCADARRLAQIFINLIDNAIKFTEKGKITISFEALEKTASAVRLQFKIQDTGIGIPEDKLEYIFETFTQLRSSYEGQNRGTGLGLAIVKKIVEGMQGKIKATSIFGKGSSFIGDLLLPLSKTLAITLEDENTTTIGAPIKKNLKALLVEDDLLNQRVASLMLEEANCEITIAADANTALNYLDQKKFDIIITDIGLPNISGYDLTELTRKGNSPNKNTLIIALTAHALETEKQKCLDIGINHVLTKPLFYEDLIKILNSC